MIKKSETLYADKNRVMQKKKSGKGKREKSSAGCYNVPLKHFVDIKTLLLREGFFFTVTVHKDLCEKATKQQHRALSILALPSCLFTTTRLHMEAPVSHLFSLCWSFVFCTED